MSSFLKEIFSLKFCCPAGKKKVGKGNQADSAKIGISFEQLKLEEMVKKTKVLKELLSSSSMVASAHVQLQFV